MTRQSIEDILTTLLDKVDKRAEHDEQVITMLAEQNKTLSETYVHQINCLAKARDNAYHQIEMQAGIIAKQNDNIMKLQEELTKTLHNMMSIIDKSKSGVTINQ